MADMASYPNTTFLSMKTCTRCKVQKPTDLFYKARRETDGLQDRCIECCKESGRLHRKNNIEKERIRHAEYHQANKERINKRTAEWQKKNRDKCRVRSKRHYDKHPNRKSERAKRYRENESTRNRLNLYSKEWNSRNKEHLKKYWREYQKNNRGAINSNTNKRKAAKKRAIPKWANFEDIRAIYKRCAAITKQTGVEHHVDHIVPLQGKGVCGLHCEHNLQILSCSENVSKNNKWWPDMP